MWEGKGERLYEKSLVVVAKLCEIAGQSSLHTSLFFGGSIDERKEAKECKEKEEKEGEDI